MSRNVVVVVGDLSYYNKIKTESAIGKIYGDFISLELESGLSRVDFEWRRLLSVIANVLHSNLVQSIAK